MKTRFCVYLLTLFSVIACHADPGIISYDDSIFNGLADTLICDSIPVPNKVFSNVKGEVLVFTDASQNEFDTLICIDNEANSIPYMNNSFVQCCENQYFTIFSTNWLPKPDVYQIEFSCFQPPYKSIFKAKSITIDDFEANSVIRYDMPGQVLNSIVINGNVFPFPIEYKCLSGKPCVFAESFIFANSQLVAFNRKGKWWTKK